MDDLNSQKRETQKAFLQTFHTVFYDIYSVYHHLQSLHLQGPLKRFLCARGLSTDRRRFSGTEQTFEPERLPPPV